MNKDDGAKSQNLRLMARGFSLGGGLFGRVNLKTTDEGQKELSLVTIQPMSFNDIKVNCYVRNFHLFIII